MKSYLFYSSNCTHSTNLIKLIHNENLMEEFNLIELETNIDKIPSYIKKVPTIISSNLSKPLIGIECINWVSNKKYFNQITNNITNNNVIHIDIKPALDGLEFNKKESNTISDSYTSLNDTQFDKKMMDFNNININTPITSHIQNQNQNHIQNQYKQPITNNKLKELILSRKNQLNR